MPIARSTEKVPRYLLETEDPEEKTMVEDNEKGVRAFYDATVPGHREALRGLQSPRVIYDLPERMPIGCDHFDGLQDVFERFLTSFYTALDVQFIAEEFISAGENVVALARIEGTMRKAAAPADIPFAHGWTVRDGYLQRLRAFTDTALLAHALAKQ
jgi:ketosteroid isomerase-like protein